MFGLNGIIFGVTALALVAGSAVVMHKIDTATLNAYKAEYADEKTQAVKTAMEFQAASDKVALNSAVLEATAQQTLETKAVTAVNEVPIYVPQKLVLAAGAQSCIPYGFVRVLDAAALGRSAADLPLPSSQPADSCAPIDADALAKNIVANYYAAQENAEQLNALISVVEELAAVSSPRTTGTPSSGRSSPPGTGSATLSVRPLGAVAPSS